MRGPAKGSSAMGPSGARVSVRVFRGLSNTTHLCKAAQAEGGGVAQ